MSENKVSTPDLASTSRLASGSESSDIGLRTLRTVAILVGACVLFVGVLSLAAVFITSKAVGSSSASSQPATAVDNAAQPKKPLSI